MVTNYTGNWKENGLGISKKTSPSYQAQTAAALAVARKRQPAAAAKAQDLCQLLSRIGILGIQLHHGFQVLGGRWAERVGGPGVMADVNHRETIGKDRESQGNHRETIGKP